MTITENLTFTKSKQLSLPSRIEKAMRLKPGERLAATFKDDKVILERPRFTLENVFGSVAALPDDDSVSIDERIQMTQEAHFEERAELLNRE